MKSTKRVRAALIATAMVLAGAGITTASAETLEELVAAAKQDDHLVLYGAPAESNLKQVADAFEATDGIRVGYPRLPSGPLTKRVDAEIQAGRIEADVAAVSEIPWARQLAQAGHIMSAKGLPAQSTWPKEFWDDYVPGITVVVPVLMYNTNLVKGDAIPKSWEDLLDPQWKGKIGMTTANAGMGAISIYNVVAQKLGWDYFTKLAENDIQIVASTSAASSQVASGEMALLLPTYGYVTRPLKEKGAPVDEVHLDITPIYTRTVVALKEAKNKAAARLFVNWSMTPEGQLAWNGNYFASSPLPDIETTLTIPKNVVVVDQDKSAAEAPKVVETFNKIMGQ